MVARTIVIGAGPAGLTAAVELLAAGVSDVLILEATEAIGGLSRTVNYKGNRIDIGGHRFFSKSDWVMQWWQSVLPVASSDDVSAEPSAQLHYQGEQRLLGAARTADPAEIDVMLLRRRLSRILFAGEFFDYPLKLSLEFVQKLGLRRCLRFGLSYMWAKFFPRKPEVTLEDFFVNRFGRKLYRQFFKEYTEKVWGRSCNQISAEWGAQRVKSLSITKAMLHALMKRFSGDNAGVAEVTSLIERFLYPKLGPGQMWETVARRLEAAGARVEMLARVTRLDMEGRHIVRVGYMDAQGNERLIEAAHVISTMPVRDLVQAMGAVVPSPMRAVAHGLEYRDFITVGLLFKELRRGEVREGIRIVPDNWIYIQEPGVRVGRLQIFNNWSPFMVADPKTVWVGLEYFCQEGDALWDMSDADLLALAKREMQAIGLADEASALDGVVIRMPKAYPGYYGTYEKFDDLRSWLDAVPNLFLVGRNGMHRYNNQDHSMLSAKAAVECIVSGSTDKSAIWAINVDDDYHEESRLQRDNQRPIDMVKAAV